MVFEQGDIVLVDFDPSVGHEPRKYRPALVISSTDFNKRCALTALAPITSTDNRYPLHVYLEDDEADIRGYVVVEGLRTLDLNCRRCRVAGSASKEVMDRVLELVGAVFGI